MIKYVRFHRFPRNNLPWYIISPTTERLHDCQIKRSYSPWRNRHLIRTSWHLYCSPAGKRLSLVVQLTGLTGLEGTFGQWYVSVGRGGSKRQGGHASATACCFRLCHMDSWPLMHTRVEVVLMGRLLKCSYAPFKRDEYSIHINTSIKSLLLSKQRNTSKPR